MNRQILASALLSSAVLLGCTGIDIPLAVTIRSPNEDATLLVGQSFRVIADSDLAQPPDQPTRFELELLDRSTGFNASWQVDITFGTAPRILDEAFLVPLDAPAGDDYVLRVSVLPVSSGTGDPTYAFTDTIRVRVAATP